MQLAVGSKGSLVESRLLPSTIDATDSRSAKSCSAARSRDSLTAVSDVLPNFDFKDCGMSVFCHQHLTPIEGEYILRDLFLRGQTSFCFLFEWHPAEP